MKKYCELFYPFFKIGLFTIGGGYAMIPMIQDELVKKKQWLNEDDFFTIVAVVQASPGVIAINMAVLIGKRLGGIKGLLVTTLATILPSFIIILLIASFFQNIQEHQLVEAFFKGVRPAVLAFMMIPIINMYKKLKKKWYIFLLPPLVVLILSYNVSPIIIILATIAFQLCSTWIMLQRRGEK